MLFPDRKVCFGWMLLRNFYHHRSCLVLAFNRAIGYSCSLPKDSKMNDPVEAAKRLAAFKAVDNHVVVMNQTSLNLKGSCPRVCLFTENLLLGWCHWNREWIYCRVCCGTTGAESEGWGFGSHLRSIFFPSQAVNHSTWTQTWWSWDASWGIHPFLFPYSSHFTLD